MEAGEGADASRPSADLGVESKPSSLFRLMRLVRETQCEMEVVKPVLDELEVMRLCRSFGMMSSVNPKDFDFDVLHAQEFDGDFVRFLRYELFENSCPGDVKLKGLFGKQARVSETLVDMEACSTETVVALAAANEGIYCVKINPEEKVAGLVVFSWLRDELFEPQGLRGTPAFALRFLTGLTPDIVCCTSSSDLEQITAALAASDEQADDELSSYSVSFHIEKQEDQPDSTECAEVTSVDLEALLVEDCANICLLKGSYPAVAVTKTMNSVIRTESFRRTFRSSSSPSFAAWLKAESEHHRIDLSPTMVRLTKLCQNVLREFDMWPEEQVKASQDAYEKQQQEEYKAAAMKLENEIVRQRTSIDGVSDALFQLHSDKKSEAASFEEATSIYEDFQKWLLSVCSWKLDRKFKLLLEVPIRLREIETALFELYSRSHEGELAKLLEMCATTPKTELLQAINKRQRRMEKKQSSDPDKEVGDDGGRAALWESFLATITEPLTTLRTKWWIAMQSGLAAARDAELAELKSEHKDAKAAWYASNRHIMETQFHLLRKHLLSMDGLLLSVSTHTRARGIVYCDVSREVHAPPTAFLDIVKLDMQKGKPKSAIDRQETLGRLQLPPNENHVAMFTVKVRSAVQICTGKQRMCAKFVYFPPGTDPRRPPRATERVIRTFGQFASLCDYDARNRIMTFVSKDSVGVYKFDEAFKQMELLKIVDLGVRSTLSELPFTDVLLLDSTIYVTDSSGCSQAIDIHNDQTSNVISVYDGDEANVSSSRLLGLADNLAIGLVSHVPSDDGAFEGELECISRDDHRHLPVLPLGVKFLTDRVSVQCVDDGVLVLDPLAQKVYLFSIRVIVRSDSYRMRQSDKNGETYSEAEASNTDCPRKQHWMYALYHVFEKFPVRGLLDSGPSPPLSILVACPGVEEVNAALESYHDFLSLLMSDLMALNKPLHGLDLTNGLTVRRSLSGVGMQLKPLKAFFQILITFLPIQICRAEGNALTVLHDGMDHSLEPEEELQTWGAADIAESIRFGLLSPLLCAWRGRCVVITSMGKQSTGKSYFLNHLTGSSFAIAGNRCTDGAWMTLRIMQDVLLVVLDFEGLGSFERTDQEDVFLSVLNASLSMFTIFRMEMRFDKDIDGLFTKFQKGINLLKSDERLFQGTLYMSVKDVNPNDRHGVLSEFQRKFQKLLTANREKNFLTEMYSGKLGINCSPPLGTLGYYDSLRHARQLIEKLVNEPDSSRGFKSGSSFHDCIRLVLAKISILDWTAVDESSQRLEMNELHRKLPGAIRTGCLIPVDAQTKTENLPRSLMDPLLHDESVRCMLDLKQISRDYPDFSESWKNVDQEVSLDGMDDEDVDFGPSASSQANVGTGSVHFVLINLFQRYLALILKGPLEKIVEKDYLNFDSMLAFLVCRRKTKIILWVKQFLGTERFMDEWEKIEQIYILPFETLFKRCLHTCAKCQLQCMRSTCHSFDEEHDCGMSHVCRGLCEYCMRVYHPGKEMPRCVGKAGHEGKCDCAKGDHTCGAECSLIGASNCGGLCVLIGGHDGDHRCSVKQHACGAACSATECRGKCILNTEHHHTVHKCAETQCKHACEMDSCKERCSTANHFHDQPELGMKFAEENCQSPGSALITRTGGIIHLCSSRHMCHATCEADGICTKSVQVSTSKFSGSYDTFNFELKQMVGARNICAIALQPGATDHDGVAHSCVKLLPNGTSTVHGCGVKCAACEYYCDKPVGHEGEHSAAHGNMRNMHFVAEGPVICWEDRKYVPGEKGVAEMCNMYCSSAGRGHVHYVKCDKGTSSTCMYTGLQDQRRHCKTELKPRPKHEVDEVLHEKYWKTIGWEDPCRSAAERVVFAKCPYLCDAPEHTGEGKSPSYCDLDAWHPPAQASTTAERRGFSFVSGHRFACSHTSSTGKVHHVFVLDCSGSMRGEPWRKLVSGVRGYLGSRLASGATQDIVSVVTFGDRGIIEYEGVPIKTAPSRRVDFHGGGTFYSNGLSQANAILSRSNLSVYKPVMIFFTDGRPADRKKGPAMAVAVRERYAKYGLRMFVVGYGRASDMGLSDLAEKLGGSVHEALTTAELGETFQSISMSLGARAGLVHSTTAAA
ncbi:Vacuolar protein sorting-associated protein 13A [Phytophthora pseudosyringae]|uniref:Vacuolar protein sorting-associated protein 13A n=1 Tax=Phytophthora pseudosyringae TaxID=221518 RepID=A0A8T1VM29_9STRA|nr:Vacuolar protein sorting-associated protein 13A [Phytophthora pseudosyringae]